MLPNLGCLDHGSQEILDYAIDFSERLTADADAKHDDYPPTWTTDSVTDQPTLGDGDNGAPAPGYVSGRAIVWVKQGVIGATYRLTCTLRTTGGRTYEESFALKCVDK